MLIGSIFVRFYKSFNFDYLRKYHGGVKRHPWECVGEFWEPFIRVRIDPQVTAIVGANESGKTHLLTAIEKVITGDNIKRDDFCRYSKYFTVERGNRRLPDFGLELVDLSEREVAEVKQFCPGEEEDGHIDRVLLFRTESAKTTIYIPNGDDYRQYVVDPDQSEAVIAFLPRVFRIDSSVPLPDSVPLNFLAREEAIDSSELLARRDRVRLADLAQGMYERRQQYAVDKPDSGTWKQIVDVIQSASSAVIDIKEMAQYELARELLQRVAKIDPTAFQDLQRAIGDGDEGYVSGLIQQINTSLEKALNFPKWWVQDRQFRLIVSPREHELVFTIRDRTGTEYSFDERSHGLKFFLSYYIQLLAHEAPDDQGEVLLMDEPDAFLSSQGQQDLLRLFEEFAGPQLGKLPAQAIYVTHSPYAIDKNHGERIRVLEKGAGEEGTRVVSNVARNHYEPLRSSLGPYTAETVFIGNGNLIVEGLADQVLLAGMATRLRSQRVPGSQTLDLNRLTIVPAGGAQQIPYLVYLARGRDAEQPAITVLLDSDPEGDQARRILTRKGGLVRKRTLLKDDYILQIGDLSGKPHESSTGQKSFTNIEDLIPLEICADAANLYFKEVAEIKNLELDEAAVRSCLDDAGDRFRAVVAAAQRVKKDVHIEKVGFARSVIELVRQRRYRTTDLESSEESSDAATEPVEDLQSGAVTELDENFQQLFQRLNERIRKAERELSGGRVRDRIEREKEAFKADFQQTAPTVDDALLLFETIEAALDESRESDMVRLELQGLRREVEQYHDLAMPLPDPEEFHTKLERLKYSGTYKSSDISQ